jgi:O-acetyl-ADP-ribose deacetylase (regulator of RNase III)
MTTDMLTIEIQVGNVASQPDCDAIVNAANERMRAGSGVCGAIHGAAGPELEECSAKLAPLAVSEAKITRAFNLPNKWVIHARGPHYLLYEGDPRKALQDCITNTLDVATANGVRRLALPAISTGVYKYPMEYAASIILGAIVKYETPSSLNLIRIVLRTEADAELFRSVNLSSVVLHSVWHLSGYWRE